MNAYFITLTSSLMKPFCDLLRAVSSNLVAMVIIFGISGAGLHDLFLFGKTRK